MAPPMPTRPPAIAVPPGACDTHVHCYDARFPRHPAGPPPPGEATAADLARLMGVLGTGRAVVVQPNAYGDDNRCTLDAVASLGPANARAVVAVRPDVGEDVLHALHAGGARAFRVMDLPGGFTRLDAMHEVAARVAPLGWHANVQLDGRTLPQRAQALGRLAGPYVIDHVGKFLEPVGVDHPAFATLLALIDRGNCWVKLSAVYETSRAGAPDYGDVGVLAAELVRFAPERMLWASNWPHPSAPGGVVPDDARLLELCAAWAPRPEVLRRILVDNPAALYGFD